ncbi:flagellar motor switch protein FliG [Vannielia litorea]|uniref:Flagellar motor switch protein FliG n=1 Tax=Vannielia litorea TaxID=1217970 RepID=A0A1N6FFA7_9RHOB|nr:FliG C-terminal domain-containing protein [Vannielia litorea]SIN93971.1 flagellar motor switch protein FliG [Vannielia litorea]
MSTSLSPLPGGLGDFGTGSGGAPSSGGLPARAGASGGSRALGARLTRRQKVAILVRLMVNGGARLPLADWPDGMQTALTEAMGQLRMVDHDTLSEVIEEFEQELDRVALCFPGAMAGALGLLDGHISPLTAARLRREAGVAARGDPWERISGLDAARLLPVLEEESVEVGAVVLSKLPTGKAAEVLGKLPGEKARRITHAMSRTGKVAPETVARIGITLSAQFDAQPVTAFQSGPVERVAAVLNFSPSATRDDVLKGLEEEDAEFAEEVKKAIFTFANIADRLAARDIPKITRGIDQAVLVTALAAASGAAERSRDHILDNMSKRMAESLREEMAEKGKVKEKDGEEAMTAVVAEIRRLEAEGEIILLSPDEEP